MKEVPTSLALLPGLLSGGGLLLSEKASLLEAHRGVTLAIRQPLPEDVDVENSLRAHATCRDMLKSIPIRRLRIPAHCELEGDDTSNQTLDDGTATTI